MSGVGAMVGPLIVVGVAASLVAYCKAVDAWRPSVRFDRIGWTAFAVATTCFAVAAYIAGAR